MEALIVVIAILAVTFGFVFGSSLIYGITLSVLWGWFIVPVFHAPSLTVAQAIGLSLVIGYLTQEPRETPARPEPTTKEEKAAELKRSIGIMFRPMTRALVVLGWGWVIHHFFM